MRTGDILVVASSEKGRELLLDLLKSSGNRQIVTASSGNQARRLFNQNNFETVLINTPLPDEFGDELALFAIDTTAAGVILLVKSELAEAISLKVEDYGVFVVEKPIGRTLFYQALKLVTASRMRMLGLKKENIKLQNKIEEIRLVDRAKCTLIQYLNMSEEQAHKYIEKQAMDRRVSRKSIAEGILKTYES